MLLCWVKAWCIPSDPPQGKGDTGTWYFMGKAHAWKDDPLLLLVLFLLSGSGCLVVLGEHPWISGIPFLLSGVHIFCTKWQVWVTSTVDTCSLAVHRADISESLCDHFHHLFWLMFPYKSWERSYWGVKFHSTARSKASLQECRQQSSGLGVSKPVRC